MSAESSSPSALGVALRDLARLRDVATTVGQYGFGELLNDTPVARRAFGGDPLPEGAAAEHASESAAVRLAGLLGALGPTYIKLGQILSTRRDLLSEEYISALETLQDDAPLLPFEVVREAVETGLGATLSESFQSFEETPLGTASIAQTHRAVTHAGASVVVKVQRPGIEETMRGDLDLLYLAAQVLEASIDEMQLMGITGVVQEFERALLRELDFHEELRNLLAARQFLDPQRSLVAPRPFPELSSRTVLTMELFEGRALRDVEPKSDAARHAVEELISAACKQVFVDGFFHGDPHAGNILVDDAGRVCLIDFGLVGRLREDQRQDLITLIVATIAGDSGTIARVLVRMGTPTQRVDLGALKREIDRLRAEYLVGGRLSDMDSAGFVEEFAAAAGHFRIKLAPEYSVLTKAAATLEGVIRNLHPDVDLIAIAKPFVEHVVAERFTPATVLQGLATDLGDLGSIAQRLPAQLDQVLHDVETGNLQVHAVTPTLDELPGLLHQTATRMAVALFAGSLSISAALLLAGGWTLTGAACVLFSAGGWTALFWWHLIGRGKPVKLGPLLKFLRRP